MKKRRTEKPRKARPQGQAKRATRSGLARPVIRYADAQIVVVEKPAGLTTMRHPHEAAEFGTRAQRFLPKTLADLMPALLERHRSSDSPRPRVWTSPSLFKVRAVHRLDRDTSGLVVFARTTA